MLKITCVMMVSLILIANSQTIPTKDLNTIQCLNGGVPVLTIDQNQQSAYRCLCPWGFFGLVCQEYRGMLCWINSPQDFIVLPKKSGVSEENSSMTPSDSAKNGTKQQFLSIDFTMSCKWPKFGEYPQIPLPIPKSQMQEILKTNNFGFPSNISIIVSNSSVPWEWPWGWSQFWGVPWDSGKMGDQEVVYGGRGGRGVRGEILIGGQGTQRIQGIQGNQGNQGTQEEQRTQGGQRGQGSQGESQGGQGGLRKSQGEEGIQAKDKGNEDILEKLKDVSKIQKEIQGVLNGQEGNLDFLKQIIKKAKESNIGEGQKTQITEDKIKETLGNFDSIFKKSQELVNNNNDLEGNLRKQIDIENLLGRKKKQIKVTLKIYEELGQEQAEYGVIRLGVKLYQKYGDDQIYHKISMRDGFFRLVPESYQQLKVGQYKNQKLSYNTILGLVVFGIIFIVLCSKIGHKMWNKHKSNDRQVLFEEINTQK